MDPKELPLPPGKTQWFLQHPEEFDPDKLQANELQQADGTVIAKIPKIPKRITRRKKPNSNEHYIELITGRSYDKETQQSRNTKTIIGTDLSGFLPGMMHANERYHDFFDIFGNLIYDPMAQEAETDPEPQPDTKGNQTGSPQENQPDTKPTQPEPDLKAPMNNLKDNEAGSPAPIAPQDSPTQPTSENHPTSHNPQISQETPGPKTPEQHGKPPQDPASNPNTQASNQSAQASNPNTPAISQSIPATSPNTLATNQNTPDSNDVAKRAAELLKWAQYLSGKQKELQQKEKELDALKEELENTKMQQVIQEDQYTADHLKMMDYILEEYISTIREQAKRRPDKPMSLKQIRTINDLLAELKDFLQDTAAEDYLKLAEEPAPDPSPNSKDDPAPGTTYGEMALLLSAYQTAVNAARNQWLWYKRTSK